MTDPKSEQNTLSQSCCDDKTVQIMPGPMTNEPAEDIPCCGKPSYPESSPFEKPGYKLWPFVKNFMDTPIGPVPQVRTIPTWQDRVSTVITRMGIGRDHYTVSPGIYAAGQPGPKDPVLVTANFKLTFDALRKTLSGINAWILVLDTRGINVWCAAGKGTFATNELVLRIEKTQLAKVVQHRRLIVPQLGATGVSSIDVKKASGFKVIWAPVHVRDLRAFLDNDQRADKQMRQVTFSLPERLVLTPVEIYQLPKPTIIILIAIFILSGIGSRFFSISSAWSRGLIAAGAYLTGAIAGTVAAPALLPWLPGRAFAIKGAIIGVASAIIFLVIGYDSWEGLEALALLLFITTVSSHLAMNFTGSTPFTSPTGVEKEMRKAIPLQAAVVLIAAVVWVVTPFI